MAAIGSTLDVRIVPGGLSGAGVTYTITPQPLPANATFDRTTGELTFVPAPGQAGHYQFTVTASDGSRQAAEIVPIDVTSTATPSTELSGRIVDEAGTPLAGIPVMLGTLSATTGTDGRFTLAGVPAGPGPLEIDGQHVGGGKYMMLMAPTAQFLGHTAYAGVENVVPAAITLPAVDLAHATDFSKVDASASQDLTSPLLPGVTLHVAAGSARTMDGAPFTGMLALTPLPVDKLHEVLPAGVVPGTMVGVDGPDLMFSTPAQVTLPNTSGLAPGTVMQLMSMDMASGGFAATGKLQVSADGRTLETIEGGLLASSCLYDTPMGPGPGPGTPVTGCTDCEPEAAGESSVGVVTGKYLQDHPLVAYQSQGQARGLDLQYNSLQADPRPVVQVDSMTQPYSSAGTLTSVGAQLQLGGVLQGAVTYPVSGMTDNQAYRVPLQADATSLATGSYQYQMAVTHNYTGGGTGFPGFPGGGGTTSSFSATFTGTVNVVNASASPLGAGWSVGGLQKITVSADGSALVTEGSRGTERYDYRAGGAINDVAVITPDGNARVFRNDGMGGLVAPSRRDDGGDDPDRGRRGRLPTATARPTWPRWPGPR